MIDRDKQGRLTTDSRAALAILGMPPGETGSKMESYEHLYQKWLGIEVNEDGIIVRVSWFTGWRRFLMRLLDEPVRIFRQEILELTESNVAQHNEARAVAIREEFYPQYLALVERERELHKFLYDYFRVDLEEGMARKMTNFEIAKAVMGRLKGNPQ